LRDRRHGLPSARACGRKRRSLGGSLLGRAGAGAAFRERISHEVEGSQACYSRSGEHPVCRGSAGAGWGETGRSVSRCSEYPARIFYSARSRAKATAFEIRDRNAIRASIVGSGILAARGRASSRGRHARIKRASRVNGCRR